MVCCRMRCTWTCYIYVKSTVNLTMNDYNSKARQECLKCIVSLKKWTCIKLCKWFIDFGFWKAFIIKSHYFLYLWNCTYETFLFLFCNKNNITSLVHTLYVTKSNRKRPCNIHAHISNWLFVTFFYNKLIELIAHFSSLTFSVRNLWNCDNFGKVAMMLRWIEQGIKTNFISIINVRQYCWIKEETIRSWRYIPVNNISI